MSRNRDPTAVELEIADRAARLIRSSGARKEAHVEIQVKSVTICQSYNVQSQTHIIIVKDDDFRLLKIYDGNIFAGFKVDPVCPFVLEILREYMVLDDLADV